jgi:Ca-activated chloride channel family protein
MIEAKASMEVCGAIPPVLQSAHLKGRVSGLVASMSVEHCYRNASERELEVTYTFPMPPAAVLTAVELEINGQKHKGVVKPKDQASEDYDVAVEDGDTPVIIERVGPGLFSATLGNLKPADEATVRYDWVMPVRVRSGVARISIPTCVKDRFGNALTEHSISSQQVPRQNALVEYPFTVEIAFDQDIAAARISCPQHDSAVVERLDSQCSDAKRLLIRDDAFLDRSLMIVLEEIPNIVASTRVSLGEEIFLHATLPAPIANEKSCVSIKLLIDCSGSMQSEGAMNQAKKAAQTLIEKLDQGDFVSLSSFGSEVFHSCEQLREINKEVRDFLGKEISKLSANLGGTELEKAMIETIRKVGVPEGAPSGCILLITDGASWAHRRIIRAATKAGVKIFCVGVGNNPAESLLHELSVYTDADYVLLPQGESLEQPINQMLARMRLASTFRASLEWPGYDLQWAYPNENTSIYASEQLHFFARIRKARLPEGAQQSSPLLRFTADAQSITAGSVTPLRITEADNSSLVKLIANVEMMASSEAAALDIALRHQLISEQTSLIVIHERSVADKAVGAPTAVSVDHMNVGYASVAETILLSGPHFSREEPYAARSESFALWRTPRSGELRDESHEDLFESIDIPDFLRKDAEESSLDRVSRRLRDMFGIGQVTKGEALKAAKPLGPVSRLISDRYMTPKEVLLEISRVALGEQDTEVALARLLPSLRVPGAYKTLIDEVVASRGLAAAGIFFLVLASELGDSQHFFSTDAERWLERSISRTDDKDLRPLSQRFERLLKGVTPLEWPLQ